MCGVDARVVRQRDDDGGCVCERLNVGHHVDVGEAEVVAGGACVCVGEMLIGLWRD